MQKTRTSFRKKFILFFQKDVRVFLGRASIPKSLTPLSDPPVT